MNALNLLCMSLIGYCLSVLLEAPLLLCFLSKVHSLKVRLFAAFWLTACSYPIVVLVIPYFIDPQHNRLTYLLAAESFAPLSEIVLFNLLFNGRADRKVILNDSAIILLANLISFGVGEILNFYGLLGPVFDFFLKPFNGLISLSPL